MKVVAGEAKLGEDEEGSPCFLGPLNVLEMLLEVGFQVAEGGVYLRQCDCIRLRYRVGHGHLLPKCAIT